MKYGVFSDVHGNYEALKAVLAFYRRKGVKDFICCGDIVGYGPQPLECVEALSGIKELVAVMGNHDAALAGKLGVKWFNPDAAWAIEFTRGRLTGQAMDYVAGLPEIVETDDFTLVHGSPCKPLTEYLLSENQYTANAKKWTVSPCFLGHTHMPLYFREGPSGAPETDFMKPLARISAASGRVMINPGSVGQPRDGDSRAACGIYDSESRSFELHRVSYDIEATQKLMTRLNMPAELANRLSFGF